MIQELEDLCPPERRPAARALCREIFPAWRAAGAVATVRINPLETCGRDDLEAAMAGQPDAVLMSKVASPAQVRALDEAIGALEAVPGRTEIVPNIETAAGLVRTVEIAQASPRVTACLVAAEDMAADLDAERTPEGAELFYARSRFLLECTAAGVVAVDCPFTFGDLAAAEADLLRARALGFKAKSIVNADQVALVNRVADTIGRGGGQGPPHGRGLRSGPRPRGGSRRGGRAVRGSADLRGGAAAPQAGGGAGGGGLSKASGGLRPACKLSGLCSSRVGPAGMWPDPQQPAQIAYSRKTCRA